MSNYRMAGLRHLRQRNECQAYYICRRADVILGRKAKGQRRDASVREQTVLPLHGESG